MCNMDMNCYIYFMKCKQKFSFSICDNLFTAVHDFRLTKIGLTLVIYVAELRSDFKLFQLTLL
jgi:hypothetical protein